MAELGCEAGQCGSVTAPRSVYLFLRPPLRSQRSRCGRLRPGRVCLGGDAREAAGLRRVPGILGTHVIVAWSKSTSWGREGVGTPDPRLCLHLWPPGHFSFTNGSPPSGGPGPAFLASDLLQLLVTLPEGLLLTCGLSQECWVWLEPAACCQLPCKAWPRSGGSCAPLILCPLSHSCHHQGGAAPRHLFTRKAMLVAASWCQGDGAQGSQNPQGWSLH